MWLGLREEEKSIDIFCAPVQLPDVLAALSAFATKLSERTGSNSVMYLQPHASPTEVLQLARDCSVFIGTFQLTPAQLIATVAGCEQSLSRITMQLQRANLLRTKSELAVARNAGPFCWHCHRALSRADAGNVMIKCHHMTCADCLPVLLERCRVSGFRCPACVDEKMPTDMSQCDILFEGIPSDILRTLYMKHVWSFVDRQTRGTIIRCPTRYCMEIQRPNMLRFNGTLLFHNAHSVNNCIAIMPGLRAITANLANKIQLGNAAMPTLAIRHF